jgi:hypothetical protein
MVPSVGKEEKSLVAHLYLDVWVLWYLKSFFFFIMVRLSRLLVSYLGTLGIKLLMNILRPWRTSGLIMLKKWQVEIYVKFLLSNPWILRNSSRTGYVTQLQLDKGVVMCLTVYLALIKAAEQRRLLIQALQLCPKRDWVSYFNAALSVWCLLLWLLSSLWIVSLPSLS